MCDSPIPQWFRLKSDTKIQVRTVRLMVEDARFEPYILAVQRQAPPLEAHEAQHLSSLFHSSHLPAIIMPLL